MSYTTDNYNKQTTYPSAPPSKGPAPPPPYSAWPHRSSNPYAPENSSYPPPYPLDNSAPTQLQMPQPLNVILNEMLPPSVTGPHITISANINCLHPPVAQCPTCNTCDCQPHQRNKPSPTVRPIHPFCPHEDADYLKNAMKGKTDDKAIIEILANRTNAQRLEIAHHFSIVFGKELTNCLQKELKGKFEDVILAMMTPLPEFYAKELYAALTGESSIEVLVEVLCTLNNFEIRAIKEAYEKIYYSSLECDLKSDTKCSFRHLMGSLSLGHRDEDPTTNQHLARMDAKDLYKAREDRFGSVDSMFNKLVRHRSYPQLRLIFEEYHKVSGHKIEKAIKKEFSEEMKEAHLAVVKAIKNPAGFFAKRIHRKKHKKNELIRMVVTRSEIDMGDIKREYAEKYKKSLTHCIKNDCSGDYKRCLLELIGA